MNISKYMPLTIGFCFILTGAQATPANKKIILGAPVAGWPPYLIRAKNGANEGMMTDLLRQIAARHDFDIVVKIFPEKRALSKILTGEIDVFLKAKEWVKDPRRYTWSDPIVDSEDRLIFLKSEPITFRTPRDLIDKQIGSMLGYQYPKFIPYFADGSIIRDDVKSTRTLLTKIAIKRNHAAIINEHNALWFIKSRPEFQNKFEFSKTLVGKASCRFMFTTHKDWRPFVKIFNREMAKMKRNGEFKAILQKYLH